MQNRAFSFIELTITISITSLLIVLIIAGKNIQNSANLNSLVTEITHIESAVNNFYAEFRQLPGDYDNASSMWNGVNGNGDSIIQWNDTEKNYFLDLALSDNLAQYNPKYAAFSNHYRAINIFDKANNALYLVAGDNNAFYFNNPALPSNNDATRADNYIFYAKIYSDNLNYYNFGATLKPRDAHNIDSKYDDGNPIYGRIISQNGYNSEQNGANYTDYVTCHTGNEYSLSTNYEACRIAFKLDTINY